MSMAYVRDTYGVPAKRGRKVALYYQPPGGGWRLAGVGRITSASNYIHVNGRYSAHPLDGVVYYDDDGETVLLDTREGKP